MATEDGKKCQSGVRTGRCGNGTLYMPSNEELEALEAAAKRKEDKKAREDLTRDLAAPLRELRTKAAANHAGCARRERLRQRGDGVSLRRDQSLKLFALPRFRLQAARAGGLNSVSSGLGTLELVASELAL